MRFLAGMGLADLPLIQRFGLGFADRTLSRALRADGDRPARRSRAALAHVGAYRASGHELFRGCVVVPAVGADGSVTQCVGYRVAPARGAEAHSCWLSIDALRLWNLAALGAPGQLIVCDDVLAALILWRAGFRRVIACARDPHPKEIACLVARIGAFAPDDVHLAFAADPLGQRGAQEFGAALEQIDIRSHRLPIPRGFDLRTFVRVHPPAEASVGALLRGVVPIVRAAPLVIDSPNVTRDVIGAPHEQGTLRHEITAHLESLQARGFARSTIAARRLHLGRFAAILARGGVRRLNAVTEGSVEQFQLALGRSTSSPSPGPATRANIVTAVRMFCVWAVRTRRITVDPALRLERPRLPRRLPRAVLSVGEVERVLARPDLSTRGGVRDRAILEVLYSTGIRRMELVGLTLRDLDAERGLLFVREGKGRKDRWVPIGERAVHWIHRYLDEVRPTLLAAADPGALFLNARGRPIRPSRLTERLHGYVCSAGVSKSGSCHIFRHTMATLMHDGGADIRDLQEMLGHALLTTTQLYTHVSLARLKAVHTRTHPARLAP